MDNLNSETRSSTTEQNLRRRSGRTIRPPLKYSSNVAPSRVEYTTPNPKRRRIEVESDSSDPEEKEDNVSITSEISDDENESKIHRRGKKNGRHLAKRPRVNEYSNGVVNSAVKLPSRPKKKSNQRNKISDKDAKGLYAELFLCGNRPRDIASQWLQRYNEDGRQALADLVNLVLKSSGCNVEVTLDDIDDIDNVDGRITDVQDEFQTQTFSSEYPLIARSKMNQKFRANLIIFFDQLIEAMHESDVLYEETILLENIHQWIAALSSSTTRPFRHTATLIALTMITARCRIAHAEIEIAAKGQRQLESEAKHKRPNKARLADFQRRVDKNVKKKAIIESQIQDYFDTVYVHRYRDTDPKIRTECIEALGTWIVTLESYFFDGQYLRYMGWMLSDHCGSMRQAVVMQLEKIMKTVNHGGIRHFIDRFRPRLIEMAVYDCETAVRAHTVELLTLIRNAEMLETEDINIIGRLIFDSEPRVRKTVASFFITNVCDLYETRLQEIYGDEISETISGNSDGNDHDTPRSCWVKYKCLAELLVEYNKQDDNGDLAGQKNFSRFFKIAICESRFTLAAQALYEKMSELKEWEVLAGYLLHDHTLKANVSDSEVDHFSSETIKPTESEEIVLLEILNAVVKLHLQQFEEPVRDRKKQTKADVVEAREITATRLAHVVIRLLNKYGADPRTVKIVLRLVHSLDLKFFHNEMRQNSSLCLRLIDEICAQLRSHADEDVLKEASIALLHARSHEELEEVTSSRIHSSWEECINTLQNINQAGDISIRGNSISEKLLNELSHCLARIERLSSISNPIEIMEGYLNKGQPSPITLVFDIIARGELAEGNDVVNDSLEDIVVQSAIRSGLLYFMWKTQTLANLNSTSLITNEAEIDRLKERQEIFIANLIASFSSRADLDEVRLLGAGALLDLHVTFLTTFGTQPDTETNQVSNEPLINDPLDSLSSLVKEIGVEVQQEISIIFCDLEKLFSKKSKKKLNAPGDDEEPEDIDSDNEEENTIEISDIERHVEALAAEEQLCQFTGKICLAILAKVIDNSGPYSGKLRSRLLRNRYLLGPNFKEVVNYLDEPKPKKVKKYLSNNNQKPPSETSGSKKKTDKSARYVTNDFDDKDEFINHQGQVQEEGPEDSIGPPTNNEADVEDEEQELEEYRENQQDQIDGEQEEIEKYIERDDISSVDGDNDTIMGD